MKNNILEYKGYYTRLEIDTDTNTLRGKIEGITDFVNFESASIGSVIKDFHDAVDDYLDFCREVGKEPEREYKGVFNVRIAPELHKRIAIRAFKDGKSLNAAVERAIENYLG